jgi:hypothetical protein
MRIGHELPASASPGHTVFVSRAIVVLFKTLENWRNPSLETSELKDGEIQDVPGWTLREYVD